MNLATWISAAVGLTVLAGVAWRLRARGLDWLTRRLNARVADRGGTFVDALGRRIVVPARSDLLRKIATDVDKVVEFVGEFDNGREHLTIADAITGMHEDLATIRRIAEENQAQLGDHVVSADDTKEQILEDLADARRLAADTAVTVAVQAQRLEERLDAVEEKVAPIEAVIARNQVLEAAIGLELGHVDLPDE